jgi:hypothetical protein
LLSVKQIPIATEGNGWDDDSKKHRFPEYCSKP